VEYIFEFGFVIVVCVRANVGHRFKRPNKAVASSEKNVSPPLRMKRFSLSRPTKLQAIAELLWFAEEKHERGEFIWWDDLPTIRNDQGVECIVIVRTIHFLALLGNTEELRHRNVIVLDVPKANA
jgi:hypothetical protein